ncbi:MAG: malate dehydrogenase [Deltaproteobacteria bacterium]|nr:malate dehydrogenase [Deltaproteobacteria bacterium]
MTQKRVNVAVTGAAGQIGYSLLFRLASGELFGNDTKVRLQLLETPQGVRAAEGTAMELDDCAFNTLDSVDCFDSPESAFEGAHWVLMIGSMPRGPGMERSDLIRSNGPIFVGQGKALSRADRDVRIVVVGNPCNTNALIALNNAGDIPSSRFSAMTALDENRARAQLAKKASVPVSRVSRMTIWGNHSTTMYPDYENALISDQPATQVITEQPWFDETFIPCVQKRGAAIIEARGKSSAASAASACLDHVRNFLRPTPAGQWFSAAVLSDGQHYDVPKGLIYSFPLRSDGRGNYEIVDSLRLSASGQDKLRLTAQELMQERDVVKDLLKS